jgi:LPXTG-motif cell wall-anchored protein
MKKKLLVAAALVVAPMFVAAPASALTKIEAGSIVCQYPSSPSTYDAQQFNVDGTNVASFDGGVDTGFGEPYPFTAVDNNSNTLYLLSTGALYATDLVNEGDATSIGDASAVGGATEVVGLAVNDINGTVYASNFDAVSGDYNIFAFDADAEIFVAHLTLNSADVTAGGNLSFFAGHIYVYDQDSGKIVIFDAVSGAQTGVIPPAPSNYTGYNAGLHVTAAGNIFFYSETDTGTDYGINYYSLATSSWGSNIDAFEMNEEGWGGAFASCTWWGPAEVAAPELPDTGVDAVGLTLASVMLLAAGGLLTLVRRRKDIRLG